MGRKGNYTAGDAGILPALAAVGGAQQVYAADEECRIGGKIGRYGNVADGRNEFIGGIIFGQGRPAIAAVCIAIQATFVG